MSSYERRLFVRDSMSVIKDTGKHGLEANVPSFQATQTTSPP